MQDSFKKGYKSFVDIAGGQIGAYEGSEYVSRINESIDVFNKDINAFKGYQTDAGKLKGDIAEFYHADTFNINAAIKDSSFKVKVDRSHDYASVDVKTNFADEYGLKYCGDASKSANAQAISHFQRFKEYQYSSGREELTFEQFLSEKNISSSEVLSSDPIYSGQIRLIPKDQLKEAIEYLKWKIAKESLTRPEQVTRYQDTLNNITSKIEAPDGTSSVELSKEEAEDIARIAKLGKYDARTQGFTTEDLVQIQDVIRKGVKAGETAAIITLVLKVAPELYKCLDKLMSNGNLNEEDLKNLGFAALSGASEGFIRGFVAAAITIECESGAFGTALKSTSPSLIGALTVIMMNTMKDSFLVVKGVMSRYEMSANLSRNIFVSSFALGLGSLTQLLIPIPFAYLLGNLVGSFVGSFAFVRFDSAIMSFCVSSGWTFFGIVKQDYEIPDEELKKLGFDITEFDEFMIDCSREDMFVPDTYNCDYYHEQFVKFIRRGVISIHQIGYVD